MVSLGSSCYGVSALAQLEVVFVFVFVFVLFRNLYLDWIDSTGHPAPESVPWLSWHRAHPSRGTLDGRHKYKY